MNHQYPRPPIPNSYQVDLAMTDIKTPSGACLWAGEYPGSSDPAAAQERMERFLDAGISYFINLTEAEERSDPYDTLVSTEAGKRNTAVTHQRVPIRDYAVPAPQTLAHILDSIDAALGQGSSVYVHCWAGIGRTGTVIGCWLVRHGLTGEQALDQIAKWRQDIPSGGTNSPETIDQRNMILNWSETE